MSLTIKEEPMVSKSQGNSQGGCKGMEAGYSGGLHHHEASQSIPSKRGYKRITEKVEFSFLTSPNQPGFWPPCRMQRRVYWWHCTGRPVIIGIECSSPRVVAAMANSYQSHDNSLPTILETHTHLPKAENEITKDSRLQATNDTTM